MSGCVVAKSLNPLSDVVKGTIKKIDKAAIAADRMRSAYVQTKEKAEHTTHPDEHNAEEYAYDRVEGGVDRITHEAAHQFDKQGRKGLEETKRNVSKAKDGVQKFREKRATESMKRQTVRTSGNKTIKAVEQTEKTIKQSASSAGKKTIKTAGKGTAKTGEREIPMTEGVKQAFLMEREFQSQAEISSKSRVDGYDDFIFVNRYGDVQNQGNLNKALRRMMRDCNDEILEKYGADSDPVLLPQFSCHILRHTFATRLCESGANLKFIQSILGHADVSTTMNIYVDVTDALKKKEITAFDDYMTTKLET